MTARIEVRSVAGLLAMSVACGALAGAGCAPRPATGMVLRFGTDIDRAVIRSVQVDLAWDEPGGRTIHSETFAFDATMDGGRGFPGSLVVAPPDAVPAGANEGRVLRVTASLFTVGGTGRPYVTARALGRFLRERTVMLDLFFSDECANSGVSDRCLPSETCQVGGDEARCVPIERQDTPTVYSTDAAPPALPTQDAAPTPALRPSPLWFPWHGARVSSRRVAFRWDPRGFSRAPVLQLCSDRACRNAMTPDPTPGPGGVTVTLPEGRVWWWRPFAADAQTQVPARLLIVQNEARTTELAAVLGTTMQLEEDPETSVAFGAPGGATPFVSARVTFRGRPSVTAPEALLPRFGGAVSNGGDLDGDGLSELLVGTPSEDDVAPAQRVLVYQSNGAGSLRLATQLPMQSGTRGGYALATGGDLDGDGRGDILVGAPDQGTSGRVLRYEGGSTPGTVRLELVRERAGPAGIRGYGTVLVGGCDFDGDGYGDYAVSAVSRAPRATVEGASFAVDVVFGGPEGESGSRRLYPNRAVFAAVRYGAALACGGDFNGDGRSELVIGDPRGFDGTSYVGFVEVFSFNEGRSILRGTLRGTGGEFGAAVASIPDFAFGDDLAVGVPGSSLVATFHSVRNGFVPGVVLTATGVVGYGGTLAAGGLTMGRAPRLFVGAPEATVDGIARAGACAEVSYSTSSQTVGIWTTMTVSPPNAPSRGAGSNFGAAIAN